MSDADIVLNEEETLRPPSIRRRAAARIAAVQTLYQHWAGDQDLTQTIDSFQSLYLPRLLEDFKLKHLNDQHYTKLVFGVDASREQMDAMISPLLGEGWSLDRLNQIERDILRVAIFEFESLPDIPARTIIAEYSAIADSWEIDTGFITAILDKLAHQLRQTELAASI
ncbi:MAG: transcription antitermination factor NusB [Pseudomonadota bacterium]|nr:transcription antitermination factor NusB [Pseudomonadota bacterium]